MKTDTEKEISPILFHVILSYFKHFPQSSVFEIDRDLKILKVDLWIFFPAPQKLTEGDWPKPTFPRWVKCLAQGHKEHDTIGQAGVDPPTLWP